MVAWTIPISEENPSHPLVYSQQHRQEQQAGFLGLDPVDVGHAGVLGWDVRGPVSTRPTGAQGLQELQVNL